MQWNIAKHSNKTYKQLVSTYGQICKLETPFREGENNMLTAAFSLFSSIINQAKTTMQINAF
jgi:hypothetical protein